MLLQMVGPLEKGNHAQDTQDGRLVLGMTGSDSVGYRGSLVAMRFAVRFTLKSKQTNMNFFWSTVNTRI